VPRSSLAFFTKAPVSRIVSWESLDLYIFTKLKYTKYEEASEARSILSIEMRIVTALDMPYPP
jgi:hypothetical protein